MRGSCLLSHSSASSSRRRWISSWWSALMAATRSICTWRILAARRLSRSPIVSPSDPSITWSHTRSSPFFCPGHANGGQDRVVRVALETREIRRWHPAVRVQRPAPLVPENVRFRFQPLDLDVIPGGARLFEAFQHTAPCLVAQLRDGGEGALRLRWQRGEAIRAIDTHGGRVFQRRSHVALPWRGDGELWFQMTAYHRLQGGCFRPTWNRRWRRSTSAGTRRLRRRLRLQRGSGFDRPVTGSNGSSSELIVGGLTESGSTSW